MIGVCVYLGWELREERLAHKGTRQFIYDLQEKRLSMHTANLEAINEVKNSLDNLTKAILTWRPRR